MKFISISLGILAAIGLIQALSISSQAQSAFHQIYGATWLIVAVLSVIGSAVVYGIDEIRSKLEATTVPAHPETRAKSDDMERVSYQSSENKGGWGDERIAVVVIVLAALGVGAYLLHDSGLV